MDDKEKLVEEIEKSRSAREAIEQEQSKQRSKAAEEAEKVRSNIARKLEELLERCKRLNGTPLQSGHEIKAVLSCNSKSLGIYDQSFQEKRVFFEIADAFVGGHFSILAVTFSESGYEAESIHGQTNLGESIDQAMTGIVKLLAEVTRQDIVSFQRKLGSGIDSFS